MQEKVMDIIIYGIGLNCKKIIERAKEYDNVNILGLADSYKKENPWKIPMINIKNCKEKYRDIPIIISICDQEQVLKVYYKLHKLGYTNIYRFLNKTYCWNHDLLQGECIKIENIGVNWLPLLVMHAANHCNLNCKYCSNFSPLFKNEFPDYEQNMKDLEKIKELLGGVLEFNLIGGEPLLNPHIIDYIIGIKERLPAISIRILTNGLLIPTLDHIILKKFHDHDITILISEYKPTHKLINKITEKLETFKIDYCLIGYDIKSRFYKIISLSEDSIYPHECISKICVTVGGGKIARCPTLFYLEKLNSKFRLNLPDEGILTLNNFVNGSDLKEQLAKQVPLCKYCIKKEVLWSQCDREVKLEDFVEIE